MKANMNSVCGSDGLIDHAPPGPCAGNCASFGRLSILKRSPCATAFLRWTEASATGKSSVSEMFVERTRTALEELMSRRLDDVRLAVMMLDGMEVAEATHVVALGITTEGVKIALGLWEGSTENATLARTLLADLVDRGLDPSQAILFVIDGGKALRRAIKDVFGEHALVHRCHRHKERNVTDLLPERDRDQVRARMRAAWSLTDPLLAEQRLQLLAGELERTW